MLHSHGVWAASHDSRLVALSVVIAILAAYVALDLAGRITAAAGRARLTWLAGGAVAMGTGIWSMHYVAMLAFQLPVPVRYHWPTVVLSHVIAVVASAIALFVVSRPAMMVRHAVFGSVCMGCGIAGMHYVGMAAMRLPATAEYSLLLVLLSVILAIAIAFVALFLTFRLRDEIADLTWQRVVSAIVMGLAIPTMHYTGMAAATFRPAPSLAIPGAHEVDVSALGAAGITFVTFMVLGLAVITSLVDRRFSAQVIREDLLLRESEARLREDADRRDFILNAAGIGWWEQDLKSGAVRWSDTMAAIYGVGRANYPHTLEEFVILVHDEDRASMAAQFLALLEEGKEHTKEFRILWPDGSVHWVESTARVRRDESARPVLVFGVDRDVTRRRELEAQVRHAQKMDAIGQLAGGVAHDFNNLLTAIIGFGQLVVDDPDVHAAARADVEEILRAAHNASDLTRQLLAFSRKQTLEPEILDLNAVITGMEGMLRRLIGERIALLVHLDPALRPVNADKGQLQQVVMNLTVNARDAMPKGGTLRIQTMNADLDDEFANRHAGGTPGRYASVSVIDTGVGMDATVQSHLFEPFYTTKERGQGTGLGLATVYGIVKQSHGYIAVESELDRGSTFTVYLPEATGAVLPDTRTAPVAVIGGTETILLVEDQEEVRRIGREVLARQGYTVVTAASGAEALEILQRQSTRVDLLLTDIVMPGISGRELAEKAVLLHPNLPVLYMSGYSDVIADADGVLQPGLAFLQKPFTPTTLLAKVRTVLSKDTRVHAVVPR